MWTSPPESAAIRRIKGSIYAGGPIGENASGSVSAYTRKTDGQWDNLKLDCDDCVDKFEEYGVAGRLLFEVGGGELDFKAKYSEIEAGAINFNASIALADAARFSVRRRSTRIPNDHNFRYINNVEPQNEQENVNLSLKGDWDLGFATLTGYVAWNDQDELLPDRRHERRVQPVCVRGYGHVRGDQRCEPH